MKKLVLLIIILFNISTTMAYNQFTEKEHDFMDSEINSSHNLSFSEKKGKAENYTLISQINYWTRKAFKSWNEVLKDSWLDTKEQNNIIKRVNAIKESPKKEQTSVISDISRMEKIAKELARSFEIESNKQFAWYAITKMPTPMFVFWHNNADINGVMWGKWSKWIHFDGTNLIRELVVVLPKDTALTLVKKVEKDGFTYYQIRTREFDPWAESKSAYYVDSRFIELTENKQKERIPNLPSKAWVLKNLHDALGYDYVWWGSYYKWIPEMEEFFPSEIVPSIKQMRQKLFRWVDCSGLLYQATDGYTPRNSRSVANFWSAVKIKWLSIDEIIEKVEPLDVIAWAWHVIIVYNNKYTIESRWFENFKGWVILTDIKTRLEEITKTRTWVDDYSDPSLPDKEKFVIRRWYPEK